MESGAERIPDALYEEMDLWYGALVLAFCDEMDLEAFQDPEAPFTEFEAFLDLWKHDLKRGMGVSCIRLPCRYCLADESQGGA